MQGNRNYEVEILVRQKKVHSFQSQERQRISQMCLPVIFEGMDQVAYGTFIEEVRSGGIKMWWISQARAAAVIAPCPDKGDSTDRAERRRNERQAITAGLADMEPTGVGNK